MAISNRQLTVDHAEVREWMESHGGQPARVDAGDEALTTGELRVIFSRGEPGLREISWEEFFEQFDQEGLALLTLPGKREARGPFYRFVSRDEDFEYRDLASAGDERRRFSRVG